MLLIGAWFANQTYVDREAYDIMMAVTGESSCILMHDVFRQTYGLHYELIPCGEDCFIDAVIFDGDFWPLLYAFSLTDEFICSIPCKLLTFPL